MGIPGLFAYLCRNAPTAITKVSNKCLFNIDTLAIDLNAVFHPAFEKVHSDSQPKHSFLVAQPAARKVASHDIFVETCKEINKLVACFHPNKRLLLYVDGVSGMSKAYQQRQRRFRSVLEKQLENNHDEFDRNSITCGTQFMDDMCRYIIKHVRTCKRKGDALYRGLEIKFSSHLVPAEGEHKIIREFETYLKNDPFESCLMHSPDADVILLMMSLFGYHLYTSRANRNNNSNYFNHDYSIVDVDKIREFFIQKVLSGESNDKDDNENEAELVKKVEYDLTSHYPIVVDIIFLFTLAGNDFLPCTLIMQVHRGSIQKIIDAYKSSMSANEFSPLGRHESHQPVENIQSDFAKTTHTHLVTLEAHDIKLNHKTFQLILNYLKNLEDECVLTESGSADFTDSASYQRDWYNRKMKMSTSEDINELCKKYIEGLKFVALYYFFEIPAWRWFYKYHYSPFVGDVAKCWESIDFSNINFTKQTPLSALEQLMSVLPPENFNLLPESISTYLSKPKCPLRKFYFTDVVLDMEDKVKEYEVVVIVPHVDGKLFEKEFNKIRTTVSKSVTNDLKFDRFEKVLTL